MRKRLTRWLGATGVLGLLLAFSVMQPGGAQTNGVASSIPDINSTAAVGTSNFLTLDGKYSNCTVTAQASTGTASIVVNGNSVAGQYGPAAPGAVNPNFGTSGTISVTTAQSITTGNVANLPIGFYFTWSGNTGTLHAWATCTSAVARSQGAVTGVVAGSNIVVTAGTPNPTVAVTNAPVFTGVAQAAGFNVGGSVLTPCDICDGTSGALSPNVLAFGGGAAQGFNTIGSNSSTVNSVPCSGLFLDNSVISTHPIDCFDTAGSLGMVGDLTTGHSVRSIRSIIGGFNTAVAPIAANYGDVEGSRSTTTGNLNLGGTGASCNLDYQITTANDESFSCAVQVIGGTLEAMAASANGIPGTTASGDIIAARNATTGAYWWGGVTTNCKVDFNITKGNFLASGCGLQATNFSDTGLSSATVMPLCGANNATSITQCTSAQLLCSATSGLPCHNNGSCALSAATTCNFTVQVPTSSFCVATANASDTTTGVTSWKVSLSTNTLTATVTATSQTSTAAVNIVCS